jgi:hypothetical protein
MNSRRSLDHLVGGGEQCFRDREAEGLGRASHQLAWRTHSITSSARSKIDCGTVRPSPLAVLALITISNLVGS